MITPLYAAIIALIFVVLSLRTLLLRRKLGIAIGTGENPILTRAIRVHSNFAEYVPIALILIFFLEQATDKIFWVHILCLCLIVGRLSHAYGVSQVNENYRFRVFGVILTLGTLISASSRLIISYFN
ncbi:MAG: MAPEG family protein [Xenococcus sp. (in: cyanobacteria)]